MFMAKKNQLLGLGLGLRFSLVALQLRTGLKDETRLKNTKKRPQEALMILTDCPILKAEPIFEIVSHHTMTIKISG